MEDGFISLFLGDKELRNEVALSLEIEGLHGTDSSYREDFTKYTHADSNKPARFIKALINEVAQNIDIKSVIDDRMYVMSWYKNDKLSDEFSGNEYQKFIDSDYWYKYVFVDNENITCQNDDMKKELIKNATYKRWQKWSSLYGMSRYSMVYLTNNGCPPHLLNYFQTEYARMVELILVQKASVLRFSSEVTNISSLKRIRIYQRKLVLSIKNISGL